MTDEQRASFLKMVVTENLRIRLAAKLTGIGYENSKSTLKIFKREGRQHSLLFKEQKIRRRRKKKAEKQP